MEDRALGVWGGRLISAGRGKREGVAGRGVSRLGHSRSSFTPNHIRKGLQEVRLRRSEKDVDQPFN